MRIVTAVFDYPGADKYTRCLKALTNSIEKTNPCARFDVLRIPPPDAVDGAYQGWVNNHVKLRAYAAEPIDENTIFIDADTVFLRKAGFLFDEDFDIAIGRRTGGRVPYNGGVVLAHAGRRAKSFMQVWYNIDRAMLYDQEFHKKWRAKYNGQNQASFGFVIESYPELAGLHEYPTSLVNAVEQDWPRLDVIDPVIMHVRKKLLECALSDAPLERIPLKLRLATKIWRDLENGK